jgi:flagellin
MSLGVLNNINAIYAENNLNNTSNSLSTVLQQLSSGSKINSGADDAAGLSLVNGLQANATALSQSKTNATEGVGLLTVADGALSQVTSLLNRAVTLATEASNGTLNTSQDAAANQEYKSILSEINNIGATTTYNQQTVFGAGTVGIYTGDSTTKGASIDNLKISALSANNVGDTAGTMSYSTGTNVFIDLSAGGAGNAGETDSITAASTLNIAYLNTDGSAGSVTTTGAGTVDALIAAINGSGRGLTATFTTGAAAGAPGADATHTGIMISGNINSTSGPTVAGLQQITVASGGNDTTDVGAASVLHDDATGGVATISYTASAGSNLSGTSLTNPGNAQGALTALNAAITNVAAQQGYVGAQINTLNSVSQVLSTQQTNVTAAQNAVQATDYAAATSNMSKYEILSQTGISALAQANSMQQEVTKLLQ